MQLADKLLRLQRKASYNTVNHMRKEKTGSSGENAEMQTTTNMHVSGRNAALLETAQVDVGASGVGGKTETIHIAFYSGSRKTYVHEQIKRSLNLTVVGKDKLLGRGLGAVLSPDSVVLQLF